jgi:Family of unknown function (DUF5989)
MQGEPKAENGYRSASGEGGSDFRAAAGQARPSLAREFVEFLAANKKWWLAPIVLAVLLIGALVVLGGSAAAPFIYTLF